MKPAFGATGDYNLIFLSFMLFGFVGQHGLSAEYKSGPVGCTPDNESLGCVYPVPSIGGLVGNEVLQ